MHLNEILLRVNRIKGLRVFGTSAYKLCTHAISSVLYITPEIRSLYLAGSMASGDFIPGLSDIDIIVVISEMSPEKEYNFLKGLERKLRYLMPPFGKDKIGTHVFVYSDTEWSLLGDLSAGKKFGCPLKIFEKDINIITRRYDNETKGLQHLYKAAWRLEAIQDNLSSPVKNAFELRARQRTIERSLQSILNALSESVADAPPSPDFEELTNRIVKLQNKSRELGGASSLNSLLPQLLHVFDLTISNCFRSVTGDIEQPAASNNMNYGRKINTAKRQAAELFYNIFGDSTGSTDSRHELMICMNTYDYFVYDLKSHEISVKLIRHYAANKKRGLRMMSPNVLRRLYLNFPTVSYTFIKFPEYKVSIMKGRPDYARLVNETYSIFPQLRATAKRLNPETYKSLSNWTHHIIRAWDMQRNLASSTLISEAEFSETRLERENEFERFRKLKSMSSVLTAIVDESTDAQSLSDSRQYRSASTFV